MRRSAVLLTVLVVAGCGSSSAHSCTNDTCKVTFDGTGDQELDALSRTVAFEGVDGGKARVRFGAADLELAQGDAAVADGYRVAATKVDGDSITLRIEPR